jgi:hypothetical protein
VPYYHCSPVIELMRSLPRKAWSSQDGARNESEPASLGRMFLCLPRCLHEKEGNFLYVGISLSDKGYSSLRVDVWTRHRNHLSTARSIVTVPQEQTPIFTTMHIRHPSAHFRPQFNLRYQIPSLSRLASRPNPRLDRALTRLPSFPKSSPLTLFRWHHY